VTCFHISVFPCHTTGDKLPINHFSDDIPTAREGAAPQGMVQGAVSTNTDGFAVTFDVSLAGKLVRDVRRVINAYLMPPPVLPFLAELRCAVDFWPHIGSHEPVVYDSIACWAVNRGPHDAVCGTGCRRHWLRLPPLVPV